jgi:sulfite reductase alpha subunit-like flavoprotein
VKLGSDLVEVVFHHGRSLGVVPDDGDERVNRILHMHSEDERQDRCRRREPTRTAEFGGVENRSL